jgi:hypothetical protein
LTLARHTKPTPNYQDSPALTRHYCYSRKQNVSGSENRVPSLTRHHSL